MRDYGATVQLSVVCVFVAAVGFVMGEVSEKWSWRSHEGFKDEGTYYHYDVMFMIMLSSGSPCSIRFQ